MSKVACNIASLRERIANAARRCGRDPAEIALVAVTKNVPVEHMEEAIACGVDTIGENRVQEAREKYRILGPKVKWHMVGHLQTNKLKPALEIFELIHSLDSLHLAQVLSRRAREMGRQVEVLLQVNTSGEQTKFGADPSDVQTLAEAAAELPNLRILGLMTIGPLAPDPEHARPCFRLLRRLSEELEAARIRGVEMRYLSMGMTNDFEVAVEEGSNMLRIGTAIFGEQQRLVGLDRTDDRVSGPVCD